MNEDQIFERKLAGLEKTANEGELLRDLMRHPGYELLKKRMESKIEMCRKSWLDPKKTQEELMSIRQEAFAYQEVVNFLTVKILQSQMAKEFLAQEVQGE